MQINGCGFVKIRLSTNQRPLIIRIFLDNRAIDDGFNHVPTIESLFDGVLDSVTLNKEISGYDSFTNPLDIHAVRLKMS
jgi:hypothetical protein